MGFLPASRIILQFLIASYLASSITHPVSSGPDTDTGQLPYVDGVGDGVRRYRLAAGACEDDRTGICKDALECASVRWNTRTCRVDVL